MPALKPVTPGGELVLAGVLPFTLIGLMFQIIGMVTMEWVTGNGFKTGLFVFEGAGQTVRIPDDNMCDTGKHLVRAAQVLSVLAGVISVFYAIFVIKDVVKNLQREPTKVLSPCLGGSMVCLLFLSSTATWGIWLGQYHKNPCGDLSSAAAFVMPNMPSLPSVENLPQMPQMPQMPQIPDVSGLVTNATAGLSNVPSMLPNATAGLPDMSGILGNATAGLTNMTSGFDPAALANMSSMLPNGTGFDPAALANMSGMLSNPAALIPGASGTLTNAPAFNPAGAVNMFTGAPALNPAGLANMFTMAPALNPAALANMTGTFTMAPFFNQGMAGMTMPPLSLAAVNGMPGLNLNKTLGFSFVFYVIGSVVSIVAFMGHLVKRSIYGDSPLSIGKQIDVIDRVIIDKPVDAQASYQSYAPTYQASPLSSPSRASTPPVHSPSRASTPPVRSASRAPSVSSHPSLGRSTGTPPVFNGNQGSVPSLYSAPDQTQRPTVSPPSRASRHVSTSRTFRI